MASIPLLDLKAEREGVDCAYSDAPGVVVRLGRMNNPAMIEWQRGPEGQERLRELRLKHSADKAQELWAREAMSLFVVLHWSGVDDNWTGQDVPYSQETALEYLTDPRRYPFFLWCLNESSSFDRYKEADKADAAKNSGPA